MNPVALAGLLLLTSSGRLIAQTKPFSLGDVEDLLGSGVSEVRILQLARRDCLLFKIDARSERRLRDTAGASVAFIRGLRTVCFAGAALEVTSDLPGLEVWLGDRRVGTTPWSAGLARGTLTVAVRRGEWRDSVTARLPVDRMVRVHFRTPRDTLAWPIEPEREGLLYLEPSPRRIRALAGGETVVDSRSARMIHEHGRLPVYLFPREEVRTDLLEESELAIDRSSGRRPVPNPPGRSRSQVSPRKAGGSRAPSWERWREAQPDTPSIRTATRSPRTSRRGAPCSASSGGGSARNSMTRRTTAG